MSSKFTGRVPQTATYKTPLHKLKTCEEEDESIKLLVNCTVLPRNPWLTGILSQAPSPASNRPNCLLNVLPLVDRLDFQIIGRIKAQFVWAPVALPPCCPCLLMYTLCCSPTSAFILNFSHFVSVFSLPTEDCALCVRNARIQGRLSAKKRKKNPTTVVCLLFV